MGACFSTSSSATSTIIAGTHPTAKVINADGSLTEYSVPVKVAHVLRLSHPTFILCDADELFCGHLMQALGAEHFIELGKLYFLLPVKKLHYPLTAAEMVALAVSASSAFAGAAFATTKNGGHGWKTRRKMGVQVMPFITAVESDGYQLLNESSFGSWRAVKRDEVKQRTFRRRQVVQKRSFRPRLSSIEEVIN